MCFYFQLIDDMLCKGLLPVSTLNQILSAITLISYTKTDLENVSDEIFYHLLSGKLCNKVLNKTMNIISNDPNNCRVIGTINILKRVVWSSNSKSNFYNIENIFLKSICERFNPISMEIVYSILMATIRVLQVCNDKMVSSSFNEILNIAEKTVQVLNNESSDELSVQNSYELHKLLNLIENTVIVNTNLATIDLKKFFFIVESVISHRPESSVLKLISYRFSLISQSINWCLELKTILTRYLDSSFSSEIQSFVFEKLSEVLKSRVGSYTNDVVDLCVNFNFNFETRPETLQQQIVKLMFDLLVVLNGNERKIINNLLKSYITSNFDCKNCYSYILCVKSITTLYKSPFSKFLNKPDDQEVCIVMSYLFIFLNNVYRLKNHNLKFTTQLNNCIKTSISTLVAVSNYFNDIFNSYDKNEIVANHSSCSSKIDQFSLNEISLKTLSLKDDVFSADNVSIFCSDNSIKNEVLGVNGDNSSSESEKVNLIVGQSNNGTSDNDLCEKDGIILKSVKSSTYANSFFQCLINILKNEVESDVLYYIVEDLINLLYQSCIVKIANKVIFNELIVTIVQLFEKVNTDNVSDFSEEISVNTVSKNLSANTSTNSSSFSNLQLKIIVFLQNTSVYSSLLAQSTQRSILKLFQSGMKAKTFHYCIIALTSCLPEFEPTVQVRVIKAILIKLSQMTSTKTTATFVLQFLSTLSQFPLLWRDFSEYDYKNIFAISFQHFNSKKFQDHITSFAQYVICSWFVKCRDTLKSEFIHHITRIFQNAEIKGNEKSTQNSLVETCLDMMACNMHTSNVQGSSSSRCEDFDKTSLNSCTWLMGNRLVTISTQQQSNSGKLLNSVIEKEEENSFASIEIRRPCGHTCWNISSMNIQSFQATKKGDVLDINKSGNNEESRKRSSTISTSNEYKQRRKLQSCASFNRQFHQSSITPEQVFLHFFYTSISNNSENRPLLIPNSRHLEGCLRLLNLLPAYDAWSTGVCYVRNNQYSDQTGIILNQHGSTLYQNFIASLGDLVNITDCDERRTYLAGLDHKHGSDGKYTYIWRERTMQMVFHITTLMPNKSSRRINDKLKHLGNNYVLIVYDDSCKYVPHTVVKGQYLMLEVIVQPVKHHSFYRVSLVFHNSEAEELLQDLQRVRNVNQEKLSTVVKQICLYASVVGKVLKNKMMNPKNSTQIVSSSNTIERLNCIQRLRKRTLDDLKQNNAEAFARYQFSENKLDQFGDYIK